MMLFLHKKKYIYCKTINMIKICGIYKITNIVNNKIYVGSAINISNRFKTHKRLLKNNIHFNSHLSGFYFLKCSEKTSYPIFYDPRQGKNILQLPIKKETELNIATEMVNYKIKPGTLIIFPSYLPHQFVIDHGIDPFRFIHFNMQAISKDVL